MLNITRVLPSPLVAMGTLLATLTLSMPAARAQTVDLADRPLFSTVEVPGNLALALSVEWPTATTSAYPASSTYSSGTDYLGYFNPRKCYRYIYNATTPSSSYFEPVGAVASESDRSCTSTAAAPRWSGNYLNWASMQSLDTFRWVLTGGYRSVDTETQTILTKTYSARTHSSAGNKSISSGVSGATPFTWGNVRTRIQNLGTRMYITGGSSSSLNGTPTVVPYDGHNSHAPSGDPKLANSSTIYELYINVRVCEGPVTEGPWANRCVQYGSNYKPEGLMQQYAMKLRYSAFGYLNDSSVRRDGGVLRARMKAIGPQRPVPGAPSVTNANAEWNSSTGIMSVNPDSADATQTASDTSAAGYAVTVPNSGVMNYLNKFGYFAQNYKDFDPVSEMYYAATRYFRNLGNVPSYSSLSGAGSATTMSRWVDGFPVIQTWDDPMQYYCQKNFILGIGDIYTHRDRNVPGSTITSSDEPAVPTEVANDTTVNATQANNMVGQLEGLTNLGTYSSGRNNSYYMAGLAYDAHTRDIRPDLPNTRGIQSISTYWLDVLEQPYESKNQYWLAAKYGGFRVPEGFDPYAATNGTSTLDRTWWNTGNATVGADYRPDNYFVANSPEVMKGALERAFAKIDAENSESTSTAFSTTAAKVSSTGAASYATRYNPQGWTGELTAAAVTFSADGTPTLVQKWNARSLLDATAATSRKIVTRCSSSSTAVPFTSTDLSSCTASAGAFANVPNVTSQSAANFISYLRGDRTQEKANGGQYRTRTHVLGDIVGSKATPVGRPNAPYLDATNSGYSAFKNTYLNRKTVVYVGANDGMLHAFDGTLPGATPCSTCGTELFAYVPSFVHSNLPYLGDPTSFTHRYFVDATPQAFDVNFRYTPGSTATADDWRTILIGGLGKGGKGYYALDVTDPASWTSESAVAGKALWEFTDSRMGFSYGDATVVKTKKYGWTVLLSSGYNNSDGRGYLFLVNPRTGALLEAIGTPATETGPINLAHHTAFVPDFGDFTTDAVYAADLRGNVWRFDLTGETGSYPEPTKIAVLTDASGNAQPVTTRPLVEIDRGSNKRYVLIGTGRLLADSDISSSQLQSLYAIIDGTAAAGGFYTSTTLPGGLTFPITRSALNENTSLASGIGSAPTNPMGWYVNLGAVTTGGIAERVDVSMVANAGVVVVPVNLPNGEACDPAGSGRVMALTLSEGKSVLVQGGSVLESYAAGGVIRDVAILSVGGTSRVYVGNDKGEMKKADWNLTPALSVKRLNWREVPTTN